MPMPGCSFETISGLVRKHIAIINPTPFTPELMIAILWESTLFHPAPCSANLEQTVREAMTNVRDLHDRKRSRKGILESYGRGRAVAGWLRCEAKLFSCSPSDADAVIDALQESLPFHDTESFRAVLFPEKPAHATFHPIHQPASQAHHYAAR